jgi:hypothetical protein
VRKLWYQGADLCPNFSDYCSLKRDDNKEVDNKIASITLILTLNPELVKLRKRSSLVVYIFAADRFLPPSLPHRWPWHPSLLLTHPFGICIINWGLPNIHMYLHHQACKNINQCIWEIELRLPVSCMRPPLEATTAAEGRTMAQNKTMPHLSFLPPN